jgi:hypothetical protein
MTTSTSIIVAAALVMGLSTQAWAGSKSLGCKPVENTDPINRYQFQLSNGSKQAVQAGANVTVKIAARAVRGISPRNVNTTFHYVLASALDPHATTNEPGSAFAKSCTASAKW